MNSLRLITIGLALLLMGDMACNRAAPVDRGRNLDNSGGAVSEADLGNPKVMWDETANLGNPKMTWGATTNFIVGEIPGGVFGKLIPKQVSLRGGIDAENGVLTISLDANETVPTAYWAFENISTNFVVAYLPPFNQQYVLTMTGTKGVVVPKTPAGAALGQPINLKANTFRNSRETKNLKRSPMFPKQVVTPYLNPAEYFVLKEPGLYKLTVVQRLYFVDTNDDMQAITLPSVTVEVSVEK